jgi:hypothetical protein
LAEIDHVPDVVCYDPGDGSPVAEDVVCRFDDVTGECDRGEALDAVPKSVNWRSAERLAPCPMLWRFIA